ncbi:MAG: hypothetical protein OEM59_22675 [Rhodospirillales bacterium]|nr:hypothetical protein [Rhodospirillales bacterium]
MASQADPFNFAFAHRADLANVAAVLEASAVVSGLTGAQKDRLREAVANAHQPKEVAELREVGLAAAALERAESLKRRPVVRAQMSVATQTPDIWGPHHLPASCPLIEHGPLFGRRPDCQGPT